jgi:hypothetical protein
MAVVWNPDELVTAKAFVVAVQSLCRHGLVEQNGLGFGGFVWNASDKCARFSMQEG